MNTSAAPVAEGHRRSARPLWLRDPVALAALVLLALLTAAAVFAPWVAPQNPYDLAQLDKIGRAHV